MSTARYFHSEPLPGREFVVPCDKKVEWEEWVEHALDQPDSEVPEFATEVTYSNFTFTDPSLRLTA